MIREYKIYREEINGNDVKVAEIKAGSGKAALNSFRKKLTATGFYEIKRLGHWNWEMTSSYGTVWYAIAISR